MTRRKKYDDTPPPGTPPCAFRGCGQPATHKAPKSRDNLREYQWLCLDHVKEYNKAWDFFAGLSRDEIEHFMKDALTGHRPTWKISQRTAAFNTDTLEDALSAMLNGSAHKRSAGSPLTPKQKKAFAALQVDPPISLKALKAQYKVLVKKHHPDVNLGDKEAEEKFKIITQSYRYLVDTYHPPIT